MAATHESIERTLSALNQAENSTTLNPAEKSGAVDRLTAPDVQGWTNGAGPRDRAAERELEAWLYSAVPDYRREFERIVIDPPQAAFAWRITGTIAESGVELDLPGASFMRFDDDARIQEYWLYYHDPSAPSDSA